MSQTNATPPDPDVWIVWLRPTGDGPPMPIRMRRFLKAALRAYGLRCIRVSGEPPPATPTGALNAGEATPAE